MNTDLTYNSEGGARPPDEPFGGRSGSVGTPRPTRKPLGHEVPTWVKEGAVFFVTICAEERGKNVLALQPLGQQLVESVRFLHARGDWYAHLFLVMPDHVHLLVSVPPETPLAARILSWKSYTAKAFGASWQDRFFDHRLRSDESLEEKAEYVRRNPVRAGLVPHLTVWPYFFEAAQAEIGSSGTPRPTIEPNGSRVGRGLRTSRRSPE